MVERTKQIIVEGRSFRLQKLPAARAYAILVELLTKALPADFLIAALGDFLPARLQNGREKSMMSMEDLEGLQMKLLSAVSEELKGGWTPVVDSNGHFQVEDLEDDMLLFGTLLARVIEFQYGDFFTGLLSWLGITLEEPEELPENSMESFTEQGMSANTSLVP